MLLKLRQRMAQDESGFTLVELLVVMLILGLLAAIAIPAFFNQRDKARDAEAKSAVRTAETAIETYATDNNGTYDRCGLCGSGRPRADSLQRSSRRSSDVGAPAVPARRRRHHLHGAGHGRKSDTGQLFRIARLRRRHDQSTCDEDGTAGCPSDGNWD